MQDFPNTPRNSHGFPYSEQDLSDSQPTDIFKATVEEFQQALTYGTKENLDTEWTQHFTEAVRYIRKSLKQEDILETATEEIRRILDCDRVVVYGLNQESEGVIIAESVAPGWFKSLGMTIKDPCFEARYIEKYQNGRVKATPNIYEANLTSCYIEQLEKLAVKANLVAPIINEGKLLGLLVAHQCSQPRNWQEYEVRCFSQIAMQVGFALDNAKVLAEATDLRRQADAETEWTQHFTKVVRYIRQSLKQEDILETATEEVRRLLGCDRVVVYGLNQESEGVIIAESVVPGCLESLGMIIKDPCFEAKYIEKYQNGRVKATPNIYEANFTSCYIEQLERLEVKANLVAPIINEGKLLGLFVAHQCSQPRNWRQHEIRWFSQIAMQVGFALDNAKVLAEAANLRRQADRETEWTQHFTKAVRYIRKSLKQEDILETATEEVRRLLGCDRVVVYGLNEESEGVIIAESVAPGCLQSLGMTIKDPCFEAKYIEKYQNGRVKATPNIYEANFTSCYIEQLEKLGVKANLVAPIINEGKLLGLFVAHQCFQPRNWQQHEIRWFSQIATQVGFALDNAKLLVEAANLRGQADTEAEWTQYFTNAVRLIRTSLNRQDILETATEETRRILNSDRVVVYGLNQESEGVIIAESVAPGWLRSLGMTIKDPCFEARYIEKYQNGRVKATPNIYEANLTSCYINQLEKLAVKANLVAPIINEGKLLGLLVAHQCSQPRNWQEYEIRCFSQIAMQVGFALDNAKVLAEAAYFRRQADKETEWTQHFTKAVSYIRQSLKQEDILETATEEVRRLLGCDRVVVYGLSRESEGVIIAESVAPGCLESLGMIIKDPCFEAKYIQKYQNGRVKATPNIYKANFTSCYIEQLEKLGVKANLVAPIINEGKLLGLFVAHQCSQPRDWQEYEIRCFSQIAIQLGFALDNAKALAEAADLRLQADTETKWTQYFTDTVRLIRQSLNREDILKTTVKEVRRTLECERVVVYGLKDESEGIIIAESVAPRFIKALGTTIKDPCFEAKYIEKYQNGRVRATDNIYEANLTPCYIKQLEKLGVKANLVAPILNEGKLLGLLVAHQCSQARHWEQYEIRWFSQIATQAGFALDNAKLLAETANIRLQADTETEWTQYFTDTVRLIRQSLNQEHIFRATVKEVRRIVGCDRVVVYGLNENSQGLVTAESVTPRFTKALGTIIKDPCFEAKYIKKYENGRVKATDNIYEANLTSCYIEQLEKLEVKANLVAPILYQGKLLGLLVAHQCSQPRHWLPHEIRWFSQIAIQVGFALENSKAIGSKAQVNELDQSISFSQQEELRQVVLKLLQDNQVSFKDFSTKTLNLSSSLATSLKQIQEIFDVAKAMTTTAKLAEQQVQRNYHLLQEERKNIKSTLESISVLQEAVTDGEMTVKQFNQHCQNLSDFMDRLADNLAKQINSRNMNGGISKSNLGYYEQSHVIIDTEKIHVLRDQLFEVIAESQPLFTSAIIKMNKIVETMEVGSQQVSGWTQALQATEQKLDRILAVNMQVGKLVGNMTQTAVNQTQSSEKAGQQIVSANTIAQQMLEQSQYLTKWFTQLATFAQGNIQKIRFWENIKGFLRSSHTLMKFFTPKD